MDTVFIKGLIFWGRHGVYKSEHLQVQRFCIDIEVKQEIVDWQEHLPNTYDYMEAREIVERNVEGQSFKLIETLAETIAMEILQNPLVEEVAVTVKKLDVIPPAEVGVTVVRKKL